MPHDSYGSESFDPSGKALTDALYGLRPDANRDSIIVIPVPYEGTVSYGGGTAAGPEAIREASLQVDLLDAHFGSVWRAGIAEVDPVLPGEHTDQDAAGEAIRGELRSRVATLIKAGKIPAVLGGEHSVPLGAIEACAAHVGTLGVLQIDAHMDLRNAYEGNAYSHASITRNVLEACPGVSRLLQIGIRDWCEEEQHYADEAGNRIRVLTDAELWRHTDSGGSARALFTELLRDLPDDLYITFDIDGLDPSLCPGTGTPVPGGLSFQQAACLLEAVAESGKRVIGFDLVEVAPGPNGDEWDANVGARVLYKLAGCAARSRGLIP